MKDSVGVSIGAEVLGIETPSSQQQESQQKEAPQRNNGNAAEKTAPQEQLSEALRCNRQLRKFCVKAEGRQSQSKACE